MEQFSLTCGTVPGRDHTACGRNNQDALAWVNESNLIAAVVCDGCSSGRHSEVGSQLGARLVLQALVNRLRLAKNGTPPLEEETMMRFWEAVRQDVLAELRLSALKLGGSFTQTVSDYFLFTVVGLLVTPEWSYVFSIGDGVYAGNGQITILEAGAGNEPAYLGYNLLDPAQVPYLEDELRFQVSQPVPTEEVQSTLIGTDGLVDFIRSAENFFPGKEIKIGPLSQFWENGAYFANSDKIRRTLTLANREISRIDAHGQLERFYGLLPDDTTLVVIRRK